MVLKYVDAGTSYIYCIYLKQLLEHCARPHNCLLLGCLFCLEKDYIMRFCLWPREVMRSVESILQKTSQFYWIFLTLCFVFFLPCIQMEGLLQCVRLLISSGNLWYNFFFLNFRNTVTKFSLKHCSLIHSASFLNLILIWSCVQLHKDSGLGFIICKTILKNPEVLAEYASNQNCAAKSS